MTRTTSSREEFERLVLPHLSAAVGFARSLTRDETEAEDVVQEATLRAYRFFHQFEPGTNVKAWYFRIVRNTFINGWRRAKARPTVVEFEKVADAYDARLDEVFGSGDVSPEDAVDALLLRDDVLEAFRELPETFREVAWLCLVEGLKYQETAEALEVPIGTVMSRLHRARRFLQSRLLQRAQELGLPSAAEQERERD